MEKKRQQDTWSIRPFPSCPEGSMNPCGLFCCSDCSNRRRLAMVEAQTTTSSQSRRCRSPVARFTTTTDRARCWSGCSSSVSATQLLRSSTFPVSRARCRLEPLLLDRGQGAVADGWWASKPREWIKDRPRSRCRASRNCDSSGIKGSAGSSCPSGRWLRPSRAPRTLSSRSRAV